MKRGTLLILSFLILSGCGIVKRGTIPWEDVADTSAKTPSSNSEVEDKSAKESPATFVDTSEAPAIQEMQEFLQLAYNDWKGVPYVLGGNGYSGIDCSAFMQVVFEDYFSLQIPRTTRKQLSIGREVKKSEIQTGDMVFFKTGATTYHVGVMVNEREFLHASTTNGVKLSKLSHPYWRETYLTTKRIF